MRKNIDNFPEVFLPERLSPTLPSRAVRAGLIRKIGPRLYTHNLRDAPDVIITRNLWQTIALLAPGAVVSHRTAFENRPAPDGSVFLTAGYQRNIALPGVTIRQFAGPGPVEGDMPYMGSLFLASRPRSFLENLLPSRRRERAVKAVGEIDVERRLTEILRINGEGALNHLRDRARRIAPLLGFESQFQKLDRMIAALLRSHPAPLTTAVARTYAAGEPYDPTRLPIFNALFATLNTTPLPERRDPVAGSNAFYNVAFFDAYFSNYIEGTEFPVDQALRIVFSGEIPEHRPGDAHDVLGTYRLVASRDEMHRLPKDFDDLLMLLKRRHRAILEARSTLMLGEFKTQNNQAGATVFVAPDLVIGTLRQGYEQYRALTDPSARALFLMFLIVEVHPFLDGNGRIARVMMNAELVASRQTRIFIPSVYRSEYINSLKALTNHHNPDALIRVMSRAQSFVSEIDFSEIATAREVLSKANAFHDPDDDVKLVF